MTVTGPNTVTYNHNEEFYEITFSAYNKATKVKVNERKPELENQTFYPVTDHKNILNWKSGKDKE